MISYDAFFKTILEKGITSYKLQKDGILTPNGFKRIKDKKGMTTETLDRLCDYLQCDISDIVNYSSSVEGEKTIEQKETTSKIEVVSEYSDHEKMLVEAYRMHPELQHGINALLGIPDTTDARQVASLLNEMRNSSPQLVRKNQK